MSPAATEKPPAAGGQRRRHLRRAGAAAAVGAVLGLVLVTWEDGAEKPAAPEPVAQAPQPEPPSAPPAVKPEPPPAVKPEPPPAAGPEAGKPAGPAMEADSTPPTTASPQPPAAPETEAPAVAPKPAAPPAPAPEPSRAEAPAPTPEPPAAKPAPPPSAPGKGYTVQSGGFIPSEQAERLRGELAAEGYPGYVQTRVMLGPFSDRKAAEAAQARLRSTRKLEGVVATTGGNHVVQLGVFSAAENAERLRSELGAEGYPLLVHGRVVAGPFADRKAAEAARTKLRASGKLDGTVVPPSR